MILPPQFSERDGALHVEGVPLSAIAERFGTPTYVYSKAALLDAYHAYSDAIAAHAGSTESLVCYAVKANPNLAILDLFAREGAGFDIVSGGELERVLRAGGKAEKVIFSGVGKSRGEMARALEVGIHCFNVESRSEIEQLGEVARAMGKIAPVSLRINPDVDAQTHPYISTGLKSNKFGIAFADAPQAYRDAAAHPHLEVIGVDCHIGSQLLQVAPLLEALDKLIELIERLEADGIPITHLDLGGGIGVLYGNETEPSIAIAAYIAHVFGRMAQWQETRRDRAPLKILFEPGRSLVGNAGVLLSRVLVLKHGEQKNFAVVDAAMNDLIRPSLYDAWHEVVPLVSDSASAAQTWDLVGPICESGDWLAKAREMRLAEGDVVAFMSAGAYAMSMASNYNSRPRGAEVLVDGTAMHVIRRRETLDSLFASESLAP